MVQVQCKPPRPRSIFDAIAASVPSRPYSDGPSRACFRYWLQGPLPDANPFTGPTLSPHLVLVA